MHSPEPAPSMGLFLADRLRADYVVSGTTSCTGQTLNTGPDFFTGTLLTEQGPPEPDSLDTVMGAAMRARSRPISAICPLRMKRSCGPVTRQRHGAYYSDLNPLDAYDAIVHIPHVTAADLDRGAVAESHEDIPKALAVPG